MKLRSRSRLCSVVTVLAAGLAGGIGTSAGAGAQAVAHAPGVSQKTITIGLSTDLTGANSTIGLGAEYGVYMAEHEIDAHGGINGRKLVVDVADSQSTPEGGLAAVRQLIQSDHVFAIDVGSGSGAALGGLSFVEGQGTPYLASVPSVPQILHPFFANVFQGAVVPPATEMPLDVAAVKKYLKVKTVALVISSDSYALAAEPLLEKAFAKAGIKVVTVENYTDGSTDFSAQILGVKNADPAAVFIDSNPTDAAHFVVQARQLGLSVPMAGDSGLSDPKAFLSVAGSAASGFLSAWQSASQFIGDHTAAMGKWLKAFTAEFPSAPSAIVPNQWTLQTYADTFVIAEALLKCNNKLTQSNFITQMEGIHHFVAGKKGLFPYAYPIGIPRTFTATRHQGTAQEAFLVVKNGQYVSA